MSALIEIKNLTKSFTSSQNTVTVLKNVNLSINIFKNCYTVFCELVKLFVKFLISIKADIYTTISYFI